MAALYYVLCKKNALVHFICRFSKKKYIIKLILYRNRPSFYGFNHRARALHPDYIPPTSVAQSARRGVAEIPERFLS